MHTSRARKEPKNIVVQPVDEENLRAGLRIARWVARQTVFGESRYDDRLSAALEGVAVALKTYDPSKGISFATWAVQKAQFYVLEQQRQEDYLSRTDRRAVREGTFDESQHFSVEKPTSLSALVQLENSEGIVEVVSSILDETSEREYEDVLSRQFLASRWDRLTPREQIVLFRVVGLNELQKDIAPELGVTASRVSQIVGRAIYKLSVPVFHPEPARARAQSKPQQQQQHKYVHIPSPRQIEILELHGDGHHTPSIAKKLGLSQLTIRAHDRQTRKQLGVHNITHAYAIAFRNGWLTRMPNVKGKRVTPDRIYRGMHIGDYTKGPNDKWWILPPGGHLGMLSDGHTVTEHEDGTISVWPSIQNTESGWHGWLVKGIFTEDYHSVP